MRTQFVALAMAVLSTATTFGQTGIELLKEATNMQSCYTRFLPYGATKTEMLNFLRENEYRIAATNENSILVQDGGYNYALFFKKGLYASFGVQITEQTRTSALSMVKLLGDLAALQNEKPVTDTSSSKMYLSNCEGKTHFVSATVDNKNNILIIYGWVLE